LASTGALHTDLLVAIGSKNPAKTVGTRNVFRKFFPESRFVEVDARRVAPAQPIGMDQVTGGALARAEFALGKEKADFGVGVEAGILPVAAGRGINLQIAVIVDKKGNSGMGFSSGFMVPASFLKRMQEKGAELDEFSHELTRTEKITEEEGIVYHLTKGSTSRLEMTEESVGMALVPWLNRESYGITGL